MATVSTLDNARRFTTVSESQAVASSIGEAALERVSAQQWSKVALAAAPTQSSDPKDPAFYVRPTCPSSAAPATPPCYQWDEKNAANTESLVIDSANGDTVANPQTWTAPSPSGSALFTGKVWRFVTWVNDPLCTGGTCAAQTGYKRITVAVTISGNAARNNPIVLSTVVGDNTGGTANPLTDPGTSCDDAGASVPCAY